MREVPLGEAPLREVPLGEIMVIRGGSLNPARFPDEDFELYSIPAHDRGGPEVLVGAEIGSSKQLVQPGDVLLAKIIPHIRRARVVGLNASRRQIASSEWIVFRSDAEVPDYLRHYLTSDAFHAQFMNTVAGVGGSLVRARPAHVKSIPVPLPPLAEQRRIAAILDHADALRAKRRQVLDHLDSLPQAIFHAMFSTAKLPVLPLGEFVTESLIGLVRSASDTGSDKRFPYMKMDAITSDGELDRQLFTATEATDSELLRFEARDGDLMFNTRNSRELVGKSAVFRGAPALFNNNLMRIRFKDTVEAAYVHAYLHSAEVKGRLESRKSGTTSVFAVYAKDLMTLPIPIPSREEQSRFANRVEVVHRKRAVARASLATQDELFASLQSRAFRRDL